MGTTCYLNQNGQTTAQVETLTVTAVANGATITGTLNGKTVTYACTASDTTSTAAAAFQALLSASSAPAEFGEITFSVTNNAITCTANVPGTPFANVPGTSAGLTFTASGGAAVTQAHTTANSSPSDAANPNNWLRNGAPGLPQPGDDLVLADSTTPLLWNLDQLAGVMLNSLTRWQSMEGQVGLPETNANGYQEWRAQSFVFSTVGGGSGSSGQFKALLGAGQNGSGPPLERYKTSSAVAWTVLASGSASGDYAVRLQTGPGSTLYAVNATVGVCMLPGESASFSSVVVDGGGSLALGTACTFTSPGTVAVKNGSAFLMCAPPSLSLEAGAQATVNGAGLNFAAVSAVGGSTVLWLSDSAVQSLTLQTGSTFDRTQDVRPMTVNQSAIDADCSFLDPNNTVTFSAATALRGAVRSGPIQTGAGRTFWVR